MELFGRFFDSTVFIYARNWLIINLADQSQQLIPITSELKLESHQQSLQIEWLPLGLNISVKNEQDHSHVTVPGELHRFNISEERAEFEISTFEKERVTYSFDDLLSSKFDLHTSMRLMCAPNGTQYNLLPATREQMCVVYLHGGPYQRHANEYNAVLSNCAKEGFNLVIPHYPGDPFSGNTSNTLPGSEEHIAQLRSFAAFLQQRYENIIYVGHSFGCYLGQQLLSQGAMTSFVSINGLFDLKTLKECSPKTFSEIKDTKTLQTDQTYRWIHIQSDNDPIVDMTKMNSSLNRIPNKPTTNLVIESKEHELIDTKSINFVVEKICDLARK